MKEISPINQKLRRLYQEVGEEAGLEATLMRFYQKMASDILVGFFFDGKDLGHIVQQQKKFLMRAMGASQSYDGKPPARAHEKLAPILEGHFDRRLKLLEETLRESGLSESSIETWVGFEDQFRRVLVKS